MVFSLTGGGPGTSTQVISYLLYSIGWVRLDFGRAAALALMHGRGQPDADCGHAAHHPREGKERLRCRRNPATSGIARASPASTREGLLTNIVLVFITLVALVPIVTTVLISFKREEDVTRKPPVIFPCDTRHIRVRPRPRAGGRSRATSA